MRKETYYQLSRVYLLATSTLAFFIPLVQLGILKPQEPIAQVANVMPANITFGDIQAIPMAEPAVAPTYSLFDYCLMAYGVITVAMLVILCVKVIRLIMLSKRNAKHVGDDFVLVEVENDSVAFSFFRYLFINAKLATSATIIHHERVHIRQKHSFDIIYLELLKVMNWFNPVVYLLQNSVKELHEYIADQQTAAFESGNDNYADFLISNAYGVSQTGLTNSFFNKNLLKKRITMLYRERSGRAAKLKYMLALPLLFALLCISTMAFTDKSYGLVDLLPRHIEAMLPHFAFTTTHLKRGKGVIGDDTLPMKITDATVTDIVLSKPDTIADTTKSPLIIANGKILPPSMTRRLKGKTTGESDIAGLADINPADIKSISVLKGESATAMYGPAGAHGVIIITTNKYARGWIDAEIDHANGVMTTHDVTILDRKAGIPIGGDINSPNVVFTAVEIAPSPKGGMDTFYRFLAKNINYPTADRNSKTQGKVIIQYIVEKDGSLSDINVLRAPSSTLGDEAVRVLKLAPNWNPGIQNGRPVRVQFTIPVNFTLEPKISYASQTLATNSDPNIVFTAVETEPTPSVGMNKFYDYIAKNIRYPAADRESKTQGRVILQFVVEKDGGLTDMKILRTPSPAMGEEAVRVVKAAPNWNPGIQNGKPVRVQFTIPVNFSLGDSNSPGTNSPVASLAVAANFNDLNHYLDEHLKFEAIKKNNVTGLLVAGIIIDNNHISAVNIRKGVNDELDREVANAIRSYTSEIKAQSREYSIAYVFGKPDYTIGGLFNYMKLGPLISMRVISADGQVSTGPGFPAPVVRRNVGLVITDNKIALYIDRNTTKEQLDEYKAKLLEKKISLNIDKIQFDSDKKISYIKFAVDCNDGFKGSGAYALTEATKVGFYRLYDKNAESPFGVGLSPQ